MWMITIVKLKRYRANTYIFYIIISKFYYEQQFYLVIILLIDNSLRIGLYGIVLSFDLTINLRIKSSK